MAISVSSKYLTSIFIPTAIDVDAAPSVDNPEVKPFIENGVRDLFEYTKNSPLAHLTVASQVKPKIDIHHENPGCFGRAHSIEPKNGLSLAGRRSAWDNQNDSILNFRHRILTRDAEYELGEAIQKGHSALKELIEQLKNETAPQEGERPTEDHIIFAAAQQYIIDVEVKRRGKSKNVRYDNPVMRDLNRLLHSKREYKRRIPLEVVRGDQAVDTLVRHNLKAVRKQAHKLLERGLDLDDLIQEGTIGIMIAARGYDPSRGFKFSTYSTPWIRQSMMRALEKSGRNIRIPTYRLEIGRMIYRTTLYLKSLLRRDPTDLELAQHLEMDVADVRKLRSEAAPLLSLETPVGEEDDSTTLKDMISDEEAVAPNARILDASQREALYDFLATLTPREEYICRRLMGMDGRDPVSLERVGQELALTRERVRQIFIKAKEKLKKRINLNPID